MSKVPSLKDILNEIPDEISDEEDGYEEIEYDGSQRSVISQNSFKDLPKKKFLDIPDEYTQLKPIRNIDDFLFHPIGRNGAATSSSSWRSQES